FSADTYEVFMYNLNRGQYNKPPVTERQAPIGAQLQMWWQYFSWQWMRDYKGTAYPLQLALAVVMFSLGIFGAWVHWKQDRRTFHYFGPLMAIMTIGLIFY